MDRRHGDARAADQGPGRGRRGAFTASFSAVHQGHAQAGVREQQCRQHQAEERQQTEDRRRWSNRRQRGTPGRHAQCESGEGAAVQHPAPVTVARLRRAMSTSKQKNHPVPTSNEKNFPVPTLLQGRAATGRGPWHPTSPTRRGLTGSRPVGIKFGARRLDAPGTKPASNLFLPGTKFGIKFGARRLGLL